MIRAVAALCLAIILWGIAQGGVVGRELEQWGSKPTPEYQIYAGTISAYSCDSDYRNPMGACTTFANGESTDTTEPVGACPREWINQYVYVQGLGRIKCVDTPRVGWYGDSPHIDIYTGNHKGAHEEAVNWSIQYREVKK